MPSGRIGSAVSGEEGYGGDHWPGGDWSGD